MRILVYPHNMEIGGSQLNAIELAAGVRDLGHDVVVYAEDGPLVRVLDDLGLEHVLRRGSRTTPGLATARHLRRLILERQIDLVHGYEWPPILECSTAAVTTHATVVGTVLSMAVADFVPSSIPLVVGTRGIQADAGRVRRGPVYLIEPPIDTRANRAGSHAAGFETAWPHRPGQRQVVIVSRLAKDVKLEGILTAIRAVRDLSRTHDVRLVIVGDGTAAGEVAAAAEHANRESAPQLVVMTGALADPRGAYDAADVCIGMGSSALRAMAFAKPLVVQGEGGFFETLTTETAPMFLEQGWYGTDTRGPHDAASALAAQLGVLLDDPVLAVGCGALGRRLVEERFSLTGAAQTLLEVYVAVQRRGPRPLDWVADAGKSGLGLVRYKMRRRVRRMRGVAGRPGAIQDTL